MINLSVINIRYSSNGVGSRQNSVSFRYTTFGRVKLARYDSYNFRIQLFSELNIFTYVA